MPEAAERELIAAKWEMGHWIRGRDGQQLSVPRYFDRPAVLMGVAGASSSLNRSDQRHERVLGTFNVESTHANAFSEQDQQFLELFCRDLAVALNTLELLVFERATVASEARPCAS